MSECLYRPTDEPDIDAAAATQVFLPTPLTASAWGPNMQHGGPVAALLTRAMEGLDPRPGTRITRVHVDILGAIPLDPVRVTARIDRPGRRVQLLGAVLETRDATGQWRPAARALAWQLATQPTSEVVSQADRSIPRPAHDAAEVPLPDAWRHGFVSALDLRLTGPVGVTGSPTVAWMELRVPLICGEAISPLQSVMAVADTANGVGARLDYQTWTYLNTDLSVVLFDAPAGPWFGIEAETSVGADGAAMSSAVLHQDSGPFGRITQTVLVERRDEPR